MSKSLCEILLKKYIQVFFEGKNLSNRSTLSNNPIFLTIWSPVCEPSGELRSAKADRQAIPGELRIRDSGQGYGLSNHEGNWRDQSLGREFGD
jgi:hypothetical protein